MTRFNSHVYLGHENTIMARIERINQDIKDPCWHIDDISDVIDEQDDDEYQYTDPYEEVGMSISDFI